ncbi:MAG: hypothetical protein JWR09_5327 [Mucilaginibacter sp.]|jgi:hypothetical protein|nr:hypothetical protein [Mucilaginibacter sp.]
MFNNKEAWDRAIPLLRGVQGCVLRLLTSFPVLWRAVRTQPTGFRIAMDFKLRVFETHIINEFTIFRRPSTCADAFSPFRAFEKKRNIKALKGRHIPAQVEGLRADDVFLNLPFKWI